MKFPEIGPLLCAHFTDILTVRVITRGHKKYVRVVIAQPGGYERLRAIGVIVKQVFYKAYCTSGGGTSMTWRINT